MERRSLFRLNLPTSICGNLTLNRIGDKKVDIKSTQVCIINISAGGICFQTDLKLPVGPLILYEIQMKLLGKSIVGYGRIVWNTEAPSGVFRYGFMFDVSEMSISTVHLTKIVNELSIKIKHGRKLHDSVSFCNKESPKCVCSIKEKIPDK